MSSLDTSKSRRRRGTTRSRTGQPQTSSTALIRDDMLDETDQALQDGTKHATRKYCRASAKPVASSICKARHTRCDEQRPACLNCQRLGLPCRFSDDDRFTNLVAAQTITATGILTSLTTLQRTSSSGAEDDTAPGIASLATGSSSASSADIFTSSLTSFATRASAPESPSPALTLTAEMVFLLNAHRTGVGTWMDLFDGNCTYQKVVCTRALLSSLILHCVCAFTAKQLSLTRGGEIWRAAANRFYSASLGLLIKHLGRAQAGDHADHLTAAMLLGSFEILINQAQNHRRHYEGALRLILLHGINAASVGLDRANFWIWVRHEIVLALENEMPLQLSPDRWGVPARVDGYAPEDRACHYLLWLMGRATNLVYGSTGDSNFERDAVLAEAHTWHASLVPPFLGVPYGEDLEGDLCKVHFASPAAAAAMIWYHTLHIVVSCEGKFKDTNTDRQVQIQDHATAIIRIAYSEVSDAVLCFSVLPLYLAGKHVDNIVQQTRVWVLLGEIESKIGYLTRDKVEALQRRVQIQ